MAKLAKEQKKKTELAVRLLLAAFP